MADSAIQVDDVSKRFRMYKERNQSLKAALMRGDAPASTSSGRCGDVSFDIPRGTYVRPDRRERIRQVDAAEVHRQDPASRTPARSSIDGSMAALLELGSGFHPELSGRENIYLNGSILGLRKTEIDAKLDDIIDFAGVRPVHRPAGEELLVRDVRPARVLGRDQRRPRHPAGRRGAGRRRRELPGQVHGEVRRLPPRRARPSCWSATRWARCARCAIEVAWLEHGELQASGDASDIVDSYVDGTHEHAVIEMADGSTQWGSGEARADQGRDCSTRNGRPATQRSHRRRAHLPAALRRDEADRAAGLRPRARDHRRRLGLGPPQPRRRVRSQTEIEGAGTVDLHIPALKLQAGTFDLHASIVDYTTTHTFDFRNGVIRFDVLSASPHESGGIAALGGKWSDPDQPPPMTVGGLRRSRRGA